MEISKKLWTSLYLLLDNAKDLEVIGSNEGGTTYYADESDMILWYSDESYYLEDGEDFRKVAVMPNRIDR